MTIEELNKKYTIPLTDRERLLFELISESSKNTNFITSTADPRYKEWLRRQNGSEISYNILGFSGKVRVHYLIEDFLLMVGLAHKEAPKRHVSWVLKNAKDIKECKLC